MKFTLIPEDSSKRRYVIALYSITLVAFMTAFGKPLSTEVLTFFGWVVMGFLGISQWGNVQKTKHSKQPK